MEVKTEAAKNEATQSAATSAPKSKPVAASAAVVDSVKLNVEAVVGYAELTVSEAKALEAGAVLKLKAGLGDAVELRVNGVVIAHGELVAVDDQYGIRIQSLTS